MIYTYNRAKKLIKQTISKETEKALSNVTPHDATFVVL